MRDQYAGDISDYLKFALLRALTEPGERLGLAWYFLDGHDGRPDGRHVEYLCEPGWRDLDPDLYDALGALPDRSVVQLEGMGVWPAGAQFHGAPVPGKRDREAWRAGMSERLAGCSPLFIDPDNGVSSPGVMTRKHATVGEVQALAAEGRSVVLIRFPGRTPHELQLTRHHETFRTFVPVTLRTTIRVPNRSGRTSPRIRWFTLLNATPGRLERLDGYCQRLGAIPGCRAVIAH